MTAKEKQAEFLKTYLRPALKTIGYQANGQTWWEDKGDFFILINLQNFSWNSKNSVDFCFNIGVALKATMKDTNKKMPTVHDLTVSLRESSYLPDNRQEHKFRNKTGYVLTEQTDLSDFITELKVDFEKCILKSLGELNSLQNCVDKFENTIFWGDNLKRVISENNLLDKS